MTKIRVAVLRGGPSPAYDDSLNTGSNILSLLRKMPEKYEPLDVFISRDGEWHHRGLVEEPYKILSLADVAWSAMHGHYGEDGQVQKLMEDLQIPFVGAGSVASSIAHNKDMAKNLYRQHSFLTPEHYLLNADEFSDEQLVHIFRTYLHPVIIKPATGVRAMGVRIANTFQELKDAVNKTFEHSPKVMVEEYISGAVVTCVVVENVRGEQLYTLMPVHLEIKKKTPLPTLEESRKIQDMSRVAHQALGMRHYSSSDFIITPGGKIYILETNSLPTFYEKSLMHQALKKTGWTSHDFADHCIRIALGRTE